MCLKSRKTSFAPGKIFKLLPASTQPCYFSFFNFLFSKAFQGSFVFLHFYINSWLYALSQRVNEIRQREKEWGRKRENSTSDYFRLVKPWLLSKWNAINQVPAAAAKSLQSCPTLCDPIDGSPPGSPVPGILQARTLEWVAISFSNAWKWKVKGKSLSQVRLFLDPMDWSLAGSSVHGIFQARVLEWGAIAFSKLLTTSV